MYIYFPKKRKKRKKHRSNPKKGQIKLNVRRLNARLPPKSSYGDLRSSARPIGIEKIVTIGIDRSWNIRSKEFVIYNHMGTSYNMSHKVRSIDSHYKRTRRNPELHQGGFQG